MEFQSLFLLTRQLLKEVAAVNWVDLDKGQLERYNLRPAVTFPCALISTNITRARNINHVQQQCEATIMVRVAFDYTGETNAEVDDELLQESLNYFQTVDDVYKGLQGKSNGSASPLARVSQIEEPSRDDGLKVIQITFTTSYLDTSAKQQP